MTAGHLSDPKLEIGHVLFMDVVGYSKLLIHEQSEAVRQLNETVSGTETFRAAESEGRLLILTSGDGLALMFREHPEDPIQCAVEIAHILNREPQLRLRMGIHSGPVNEIIDVNKQKSVAGSGINIAQRVMDCGDTGHILLSKRAADDLGQYARWQPHLHTLGECEVKHGVRLAVVNYYNGEVGNAELPQKFTRRRKRKISALGFAFLARGIRGRGRLLGGLFFFIAALIGAIWLIAQFFTGARGSFAGAAKTYPQRSYENAKWSKIYGADRLFPAKASFSSVTGWDRKNLIVTGETEDGQLLLRLQNGEWKVSRPEKVASGAITACRMISDRRFVFLRSTGRGISELNLWEPDGSRKLGKVPARSSLYVLAADVFCGMEERGGYWKYLGNKLQEIEKTAPESFIWREDNVVAQIKNLRWNNDEPMPVALIRDVTLLSSGNAVGLWDTRDGNCATVRYRDGRWYLVAEIHGFSARNVPNRAWFMDAKNFVTIGSDKVGRCVDGKLTLQNLEVGGIEYPADRLSAVWGHDLNHYWTADAFGNVFYFEGARWRLLVRGPEFQNKQKFESLWTAPDGSVIGVTTNEVYALE